MSYRELPASPLELKECLRLASIVTLLFLMVHKGKEKKKKYQKDKISQFYIKLMFSYPDYDLRGH